MAKALRVEDPPGSGRYKAARLRGRAATTDCGECCGDPLGACCFGNGSCTPDLTEAQCVAQGGQWMGAGTSCTPNPCPPGPCQPQGPHLIACGFFSSASLVAGTRNIAAWDGVAWKPLAGGFDRAVTCAAVVNGELWVAGNFRITYDSPADTVGRPCLGVARWVCDRWQQVGQGILDTTGFETVMSIGRRLTLAPGGGPAVFQTVIGGDFSRDGNNIPLKSLAAWNGSAWVQQGPFVQTSGGYVRSVAAFDLTGSATIVNSVNNGAIGGSFSNLPNGLCNNISTLGPDRYLGPGGIPGVNGEAFNVHHWGTLGQDEILVVGTHSSAMGVSSEHTQRISWLTRDPAHPSFPVLPNTQGVNGTVWTAFRSPSTGLWYVGGTFTLKTAYSPSPGFPAGTLRRIGRSFDGTPRGWQEINGGILNGDVRAITEWNGEVYIGGTFSPSPIGPRGIARDGGLGFWQSLDGGIFGQVQALIGYEFMLPAPRPGVDCGDCGDDPMVGGGGLIGA